VILLSISSWGMGEEGEINQLNMGVGIRGG
jgi:hypothetical protein